MLNQDEVLKMATEAGLCYESNGFIDWIDAGPSLHEMTLFAKLVYDRADDDIRQEYVNAYLRLKGEINA